MRYLIAILSLVVILLGIAIISGAFALEERDGDRTLPVAVENAGNGEEPAEVTVETDDVPGFEVEIGSGQPGERADGDSALAEREPALSDESPASDAEPGAVPVEGAPAGS